MLENPAVEIVTVEPLAMTASSNSVGKTFPCQVLAAFHSPPEDEEMMTAAKLEFKEVRKNKKTSGITDNVCFMRIRLSLLNQLFIKLFICKSITFHFCKQLKTAKYLPKMRKITSKSQNTGRWVLIEW